MLPPLVGTRNPLRRLEAYELLPVLKPVTLDVAVTVSLVFFNTWYVIVFSVPVPCPDTDAAMPCVSLNEQKPNHCSVVFETPCSVSMSYVESLDPSHAAQSAPVDDAPFENIDFENPNGIVLLCEC